MRIAILRDRVHWLVGFFVTMIAANALRVKRFGFADARMAIGFFEPLPLAYFPYVATPFTFLYTADFAYGTKAERLNVEVQHIMRNENYWFNRPMTLPGYMQPFYKDMMKTNNEKLALMGLPPEKDWANFSYELTTEELDDHVSPLTR